MAISKYQGMGLFPPGGFKYARDVILPHEEPRLIAEIQKLPLKEFEFHDYTGKRRVVSFGWRYDFAHESLLESTPIPEFLLPVRETAASLAGLRPDELVQILVTEYRPGTAIGWHRDKGVFGDVVGISLGSECTFRFRRKAGTKWERHALVLDPRSGYVLHGESRNDWEHSISGVPDTRYSITFRSLRNGFKPAPAAAEPRAPSSDGTR